jgi:hypothetical protein
MSAQDTEARVAVLLLFNGRDAALLEFADGLRQRGVDVHPVPDVYAAMALLAGGLAIRHVVVDVRQLDDDEMQFLGLAPKYFAGLHILVPLLEGTIARQHKETGRAVILPPADLIESILGIPFAVTAEGLDDPDGGPGWFGEPMADDGELRELPLSTAGGPDAAGDGPTLHEAVRQRMGEGAAGPARRRPPGQPVVPVDRVRSAPPDGQHEGPSSSAGALSPDEIDALLGEPGDGDGATPDGESDAGDAA